MPPVTVVPKPRDQPRLPVVFSPRADRPWNYESREGQFYEAVPQAHDLWFRRAAYTTPPPWAIETQVTFTGKESWPCFSRDYRGRWWLLWTHTDAGQTEVRRAYSDDDGQTWSTPSVPFPNGRYGFTLDDDQSGTRIDAAWVAEEIQGLRRHPGDLTDTAFTFLDASGVPLQFANAGFCISDAREGAGRWVMTAMIKGETDWSRWASADEGRSWTRLL